MKGNIKDQGSILKKLGIEKLNEMQEEALQTIAANSEVVLLSPTGSGKTLAFLLPIISALDPKIYEVQALIIVPSRELAIQIEQVAREMGSGYKTNAVYGGRSGSKDRSDLQHRPAILIGTPGRIADHLRNETFSTDRIKTLVLDEFDKSLEIGFEDDMQEIIGLLPSIKKKILTSATQKIKIPAFVGLKRPKRIFYSGGVNEKLSIKVVISPTEDKLDTIRRLLGHIGKGSGIVFCNLKDSIQLLSDFLNKENIPHGCFHGDLEQIDRERELIKFRNGTYRILVASDLAARGIDVPELHFIIHYQLPPRRDEFIHRNGRTARMNSKGTAYILKWEKEDLPEFIEDVEVLQLEESQGRSINKWVTLHISGGRKDKISKGDIAGLFFKQGGLEKNELGVIELKNDSAYVGVPLLKSKQLIEDLNNRRLKKKKVRITVLY